MSAALLLGLTVLVGLLPEGLPPTSPPTPRSPTPSLPPAIDLLIDAQSVELSTPLAEGTPFTATVTVRNLGDLGIERVQVLFQIVRPAEQGEQNIFVGRVSSGPLAARGSLSVPVPIPAVPPLKPGEYRYYASANLPTGSIDRSLRNNFGPVGSFTLTPPVARCATAPDLALAASDIEQREGLLVVSPRNLGALTLYNVTLRLRYLAPNGLPERSYILPRLLPCGGSATINASRAAGPVEIEVNPASLADALPEADRMNNVVRLEIKP